MIIEQELERNIINSLKNECDGVYFSGAWDAHNVGNVRGDEGDFDAVCAVNVSPRIMGEYGVGCDYIPVDIPVNLSIAVASETDSTAARTLELWQMFASKIWGWVKSADAETETPLTIENESYFFHPGGVMQNGGIAPTYDSTKGAWTFSISFTVRGIVKD